MSQASDKAKNIMDEINYNLVSQFILSVEIGETEFRLTPAIISRISEARIARQAYLDSVL